MNGDDDLLTNLSYGPSPALLVKKTSLEQIFPDCDVFDSPADTAHDMHAAPPSKRMRTQDQISFPFRAGSPERAYADAQPAPVNPMRADGYFPPMAAGGTAPMSMESPRSIGLVQGAKNFVRRVGKRNKRRHPGVGMSSSSSGSVAAATSGSSNSRSRSPNPMTALSQVDHSSFNRGGNLSPSPPRGLVNTSSSLPVNGNSNLGNSNLDNGALGASGLHHIQQQQAPVMPLDAHGDMTQTQQLVNYLHQQQQQQQLLHHHQHQQQQQQQQQLSPHHQLSHQMASPVNAASSPMGGIASSPQTQMSIASPISSVQQQQQQQQHPPQTPPQQQQPQHQPNINRVSELADSFHRVDPSTSGLVASPQANHVAAGLGAAAEMSPHHDSKQADPAFPYPAMDPQFDPEPVREGSIMLYQAEKWRLWIMEFPKEIRKESSTKKDNIFLKRHSHYRIGIQMIVADKALADTKPKVEVSFERPTDRTRTNLTELEGSRDSPAFFIFIGNLNASGMPRAFCKLKKTSKNNCFHLFIHVNGEKSKMPYAFEIVAFKRDERKNRKGATPSPEDQKAAAAAAFANSPAAAAAGGAAAMSHFNALLGGAGGHPNATAGYALQRGVADAFPVSAADMGFGGGAGAMAGIDPVHLNRGWAAMAHIPPEYRQKVAQVAHYVQEFHRLSQVEQDHERLTHAYNEVMRRMYIMQEQLSQAAPTPQQQQLHLQLQHQMLQQAGGAAAHMNLDAIRAYAASPPPALSSPHHQQQQQQQPLSSPHHQQPLSSPHGQQPPLASPHHQFPPAQHHPTTGSSASRSASPQPQPQPPIDTGGVSPIVQQQPLSPLSAAAAAVSPDPSPAAPTAAVHVQDLRAIATQLIKQYQGSSDVSPPANDEISAPVEMLTSVLRNYALQQQQQASAVNGGAADPSLVQADLNQLLLRASYMQQQAQQQDQFAPPLANNSAAALGSTNPATFDSAMSPMNAGSNAAQLSNYPFGAVHPPPASSEPSLQQLPMTNGSQMHQPMALSSSGQLASAPSTMQQPPMTNGDQMQQQPPLTLSTESFSNGGTSSANGGGGTHPMQLINMGDSMSRLLDTPLAASPSASGAGTFGSPMASMGAYPSFEGVGSSSDGLTYVNSDEHMVAPTQQQPWSNKAPPVARRPSSAAEAHVFLAAAAIFNQIEGKSASSRHLLDVGGAADANGTADATPRTFAEAQAAQARALQTSRSPVPNGRTGETELTLDLTLNGRAHLWVLATLPTLRKLAEIVEVAGGETLKLNVRSKNHLRVDKVGAAIDKLITLEETLLDEDNDGGDDIVDFSQFHEQEEFLKISDAEVAGQDEEIEGSEDDTNENDAGGDEEKKEAKTDVPTLEQELARLTKEVRAKRLAQHAENRRRRQTVAAAAAPTEADKKSVKASQKDEKDDADVAALASSIAALEIDVPTRSHSKSSPPPPMLGKAGRQGSGSSADGDFDSAESSEEEDADDGDDLPSLEQRLQDICEIVRILKIHRPQCARSHSSAEEVLYALRRAEGLGLESHAEVADARQRLRVLWGAVRRLGLALEEKPGGATTLHPEDKLAKAINRVQLLGIHWKWVQNLVTRVTTAGEEFGHVITDARLRLSRESSRRWLHSAEHHFTEIEHVTQWLKTKVSRMVRIYGSKGSRCHEVLRAVKELTVLIRSKKPVPERIENPLKYVVIPFVKNVLFPVLQEEIIKRFATKEFGKDSEWKPNAAKLTDEWTKMWQTDIVSLHHSAGIISFKSIDRLALAISHIRAIRRYTTRLHKVSKLARKHPELLQKLEKADKEAHTISAETRAMLNKQGSSSSVGSASSNSASASSVDATCPSVAAAADADASSPASVSPSPPLTSAPTPSPSAASASTDNEVGLEFEVEAHHAGLNAMHCWEKMVLSIGKKSGPGSFKHLGVTISSPYQVDEFVEFASILEVRRDSAFLNAFTMTISQYTLLPLHNPKRKSHVGMFEYLQEESDKNAHVHLFRASSIQQRDFFVKKINFFLTYHEQLRKLANLSKANKKSSASSSSASSEAASASPSSSSSKRQRARTTVRQRARTAVSRKSPAPSPSPSSSSSSRSRRNTSAAAKGRAA